MRLKTFLDLLVSYCSDRADDFTVTIGHQVQPFPDQPITIYNLPEIQGDVSITVGTIRRWAEGMA